MRGDIMRKVLERISETPALFGDLFVIFTSPYGTSQSGLQKRLSLHHKAQEKGLISREKRRQLYNVLYELRKQKLVTQKKTKSGWSIIRGAGVRRAS